MLRVRCHLVTPFVTGVNAVLTHQSVAPLLLSGRETSRSKLLNHARAAVSDFEFGMKGADKGHIWLSVSRVVNFTSPLADEISGELSFAAEVFLPDISCFMLNKAR